MKREDLRLLPTIQGVGVIGNGKYKCRDSSNGKFTREYQHWSNMLVRCYYKTTQKPSYIGCSVLEEWHNFQVFAEWCQHQTGFGELDDSGRLFSLDKDLLIKGNKIYSPDVCVFVPNAVNVLLIGADAVRGKLPIGVTLHGGGRYQAKYNSGKAQSRKHLGTFDTPEDAFQAYKHAREVHIKGIADNYRYKIDERVYNALMKYTVEITD